jgi:hypothetical protein
MLRIDASVLDYAIIAIYSSWSWASASAPSAC